MMNKLKTPISIAVSALCLALAGCAISNGEVKQQAKGIETNFDKHVASRNASIEREQDSYIMVDKPWLGAQEVDLSPELDFPMAFKKAWSWHRDDMGKLTLTGAAQLIQREFGIRVRIEPEVFLPASSLMLTNARGTAVAPAPASAATAGVGALGGAITPFAQPGAGPASQFGQAQNTGREYDTSVDFQFSNNLGEWCDTVAAKLGINYRWDKVAQELVFYRFDVATFFLRVEPGTYRFNSSTNSNSSSASTAGGSSGSAAVNANTNASSTASTGASVDGSFSIWESTQNTIESIMTGGRKPVSNQFAKTITVMDTPQTLQRVDNYITKMNSLYSRQVILHIEFHRVTLNKNTQAGLDANIVYSKLVGGVAQRTVSSNAAPTLVGANAGNVTVNILGQANGAYNGSTINLGFLNEIGTSVDNFSQDVIAQNFRLAQIQAGRTKSYVPSTTPATGGIGGTAGTPGLNTALAPSGTTGWLHASIYDGGDIGLRMAFNRSTLPTFSNYVSGLGASQQQVQLIDQSVISLTPEMTLRNGQTLVLVGMSQDTQNEDSRASITGYSRSADSTRELQVLIITPKLLGTSNIPTSSKI